MAKRGALSQEYVSDDDFLDDSEEGGKKKKKPAAKKAPAAKKPKKENSDDEDEDDAPLAEGSAPGVNDQGDRFFKLGETGSRRVTVREFKKSILIDIRETYSKDGKDGLPGKKGISLSKAQWEALKAQSDEIDAAIAAL